MIFNDPSPCDDPVPRAIRLALEMRSVFSGIQARWRELNHNISFGIGVGFGYATLGLIGSEERYDYTAIGKVVNVAARLCDMAEDDDILIDQRAKLELTDDIRTDPMGALDLKGVGRPVETFRVVGHSSVAA